MSQIADYSRELSKLLPSLKSNTFPDSLISFFRALLSVDDATIIAYPDGSLPIVYYSQPFEAGSSFLERYIHAGFLLDPYYKAGLNGKYGFFRFRELCPEGFEEGEYYRNHWHRSGYLDECGYLIPTGCNSFVNISLAKIQNEPYFSDDQIELLYAIEPVITQLGSEYWANPSALSTTKPNLRAQLHIALENFGSSLLTKREAQVINLILYGYSTKMTAKSLSISIETVKLHRKNAYAKMKINSQAELFYLFIGSLMNATNYQDGDALAAYIEQTKQ